MNITLDLKLLSDKNITPNEFVYLYLLSQKKVCKLNVNKEKLQDLKYIKIVGDRVVLRPYKVQELIIHQEFNSETVVKEIITKDKPTVKKVFNDSFEESWNKLLNVYPSTEEGRALHNKVVALPKFKLCLKQDGIDTILKGLNNQLAAREKTLKRGKFFDGLQALSTWLNQKTYLMWLDVEVKKEETNTKRI